MKKSSKSVFFIIVGLIVFISYTAFVGIKTQYGDIVTTYIKGGDDIRWGIDIRGGVDVTFTPSDEATEVTQVQMNAAQEVIKQRLVSQNITDSEVYTDYNKNRIIVRFPWKSDEVNFNPEQAIKELGETAMLTFREGYEVDEYGAPTGQTENIVLGGMEVIEAKAATNPEDGTPVVDLQLSDKGAQAFYEATSRLVGDRISIWMDDVAIGAPNVTEPITNGRAIITNMESIQAANELANKINAGALPFKLETENYNIINPTLGEGARDAMVLAGVIAFLVVFVYMTIMYRLPGLVASIALAGQAALSIAAISGYFPVFNSFTLTLPGIAGIILAIGIGVDANVITAERIKEELRLNKTLEGSIDIGFKRGFTAILDGNITIMIVAVVLMGAFGPPTSIFSKMLNFVFFMFGPATAGAIYSFGYTLLVGVILNFVMGVLASRLMLKSLSKWSALRKPWLYGGDK